MRFETRRSSTRLARALAVFATAACAGCGAAALDVHARCVRDPAGWGDGQPRRGRVGELGFQAEGGWPSEDSIRAEIVRKDCLETLTVQGATTPFRGGPYRPLWDEAIVAHHATKRLAVAYEPREDEWFVWLDGRVYGPYEALTLPPRFSRSGEHVAWATRRGDALQTLYVDGRVDSFGPVMNGQPFFYVLDDGRVAAAIRHGEAHHEILVGGYRSGRLEELCYNFGFVVGPKSRWAYTAKKQGIWRTVVDGEELPFRGVPARCNIEFSDDGARYAYLALPVDGEPGSRLAAIVDGKSYGVPEGANDLVFDGQNAFVTASVPPSGEQREWTSIRVPVGPQLAPPRVPSVAAEPAQETPTEPRDAPRLVVPEPDVR
jgi:hypothetical protein